MAADWDRHVPVVFQVSADSLNQAKVLAKERLPFLCRLIRVRKTSNHDKTWRLKAEKALRPAMTRVSAMLSKRASASSLALPH